MSLSKPFFEFGEGYPVLSTAMAAVRENPSGGLWVRAGNLVPNITKVEAERELDSGNDLDSTWVAYSGWSEIFEKFGNGEFKPLFEKIAKAWPGAA